MNTLAPKLDRVLAISLPKPVPPPVMYATRPLNVLAGNMGVLIDGKNLAFGEKSTGPIILFNYGLFLLELK